MKLFHRHKWIKDPSHRMPNLTLRTCGVCGLSQRLIVTTDFEAKWVKRYSDGLPNLDQYEYRQ